MIVARFLVSMVVVTLAVLASCAIVVGIAFGLMWLAGQ